MLNQQSNHVLLEPFVPFLRWRLELLEAPTLAEWHVSMACVAWHPKMTYYCKCGGVICFASLLHYMLSTLVKSNAKSPERPLPRCQANPLRTSQNSAIFEVQSGPEFPVLTLDPQLPQGLLGSLQGTAQVASPCAFHHLSALRSTSAFCVKMGIL